MRNDTKQAITQTKHHRTNTRTFKSSTFELRIIHSSNAMIQGPLLFEITHTNRPVLILSFRTTIGLMLCFANTVRQHKS